MVAAAVSRNRDCAGFLPLAAGPIKCHGQRKLHGCSRGLCKDKRGKSHLAPVVFCGQTQRGPCEERWQMTVPVLTRDDRKALMDALESPSQGVRQARVAQALLLMADGCPAATVAR